MKDEQSDDSVRSLGNGLSRRGMLKWLTAGLVASIAGIFSLGTVRALPGQRRRGRRRGRRRARRRGLR
jgi:hypothetical protein